VSRQRRRPSPSGIARVGVDRSPACTTPAPAPSPALYRSQGVPRVTQVSSAPTVAGLDSKRYYLFLKSAPEFGDFASELLQRIAGHKLQDRIEIEEKSAKEMEAFVPDAGSDIPNVILEEVIAGPTSVILDFVTPNEIRTELAKLEVG